MFIFIRKRSIIYYCRINVLRACFVDRNKVLKNQYDFESAHSLYVIFIHCLNFENKIKQLHKQLIQVFTNIWGSTAHASGHF